MNVQRTEAEAKISGFIVRYPEEWAVVCGERTEPYNGMRQILRLLGDERLYELAALLIWRMEAAELHQPGGK